MNKASSWIISCIVVTLLAGVVVYYVELHYRKNSQHPQIEIAHELALSLLSGKDESILVPESKIDISNSPEPFVIIYDDNGNIVTSQGFIDNKVPVLPRGVLEYTRNKGEDRITWQPNSGVRIATVVTRFSGVKSGYILVGKNMKQTELLISQSHIVVIFCWIFGILLVSFRFFIKGFKPTRY